MLSYKNIPNIKPIEKNRKQIKEYCFPKWAIRFILLLGHHHFHQIKSPSLYFVSGIANIDRVCSFFSQNKMP